MALSEQEVDIIVSKVLSALAIQDVSQSGQQGGQQLSDQVAKDLAQSIQDIKQGIQGSTQEKTSYIENKGEEINSGEAHRSNIYTKTRLWDFDDKQIAASEQSERVRSVDYDRAIKEIEIKTKELELARKQHDFAHAQKLDNLSLRKAEDAETVKHFVNAEYAKFNNAQSEPISPNTEA